jgi:phosphoribosyl 1,2-cyclic phosphodiesterase
VSLSFQVLGSSSSGNATLLLCQTPVGERRLLVDAGLGPRTVARRLAEAGHPAEPIHAIVLTHADYDHIRPTWRRTLERRGIPVHVPLAHYRHVSEDSVPASLARPYTERFEPVPGVVIDPFVVPHDTHGSCALRIECGGVALGWATDLGCTNEALLAHLDGVDAIGIESNYDPDLQRNSGRPSYLIKRIMGGRGHLSNEECLAAVCAIESSQSLLRPLARIVLLHLSQECNCRTIVRDLWAKRAPELLDRVEISWPDRPSPLLSLGGEAPDTPQQALFV